MNQSKTSLPLSDLAGSADSFRFPSTGILPVSLTNDYLFRALLQKNNRVLRGLTASLLHVEPSAVSSATIMNPIELGSSADHKTFILDIKVSVNDKTTLNLEMQVVNEHNWVDRSLCYLCRNFDQLRPGEEYQMIQPVIQIGILNFTLFPEHPEFYSTYGFLNIENHTLYSDKLRLSVLDLTNNKLATKEDKRYQLDNWAALFKSCSWEEITMLAENNEYIDEAANTIYELTQDEKIRMQCEAREDYYRTRRGWQRMLSQQEIMIKEQEGILKEQEGMLKEREGMLKEQEGMLEAQNATIEKQKAEYERLLAWANDHGYKDDENMPVKE